MADETVSPRQAAQALGVSESSLKRWCDDGRILTVRTAGGHRRIPLSAVLEFLRATGRPAERLELLGLRGLSQPSPSTLEQAASALCEGLLNGEEETCRGVILQTYLAGQRISAIADDVIARAFREIGARWACGAADVYQERRGCQICLRVLAELRNLLPAPAPRAPLALGAAVGSDPYALPTTLCELVLRQAGWDARALGWTLPAESLANAVETHRPRLCWVSVSHIADRPQFLDDYARFYARCRGLAPIALGGRALEPEVLAQLQYTTYCESMTRLDEFAQALALSFAAPGPDEPARARGASA